MVQSSMLTVITPPTFVYSAYISSVNIIYWKRASEKLIVIIIIKLHSCSVIHQISLSSNPLLMLILCYYFMLSLLYNAIKVPTNFSVQSARATETRVQCRRPVCSHDNQQAAPSVNLVELSEQSCCHARTVGGARASPPWTDGVNFINKQDARHLLTHPLGFVKQGSQVGLTLPRVRTQHFWTIYDQQGCAAVTSHLSNQRCFSAAWWTLQQNSFWPGQLCWQSQQVSKDLPLFLHTANKVLPRCQSLSDGLVAVPALNITDLDLCCLCDSHSQTAVCFSVVSGTGQHNAAEESVKSCQSGLGKVNCAAWSYVNTPHAANTLFGQVSLNVTMW